MRSRKKHLFYCIFFAPTVQARPETRFFLELGAARRHAHRRLKAHKPHEKAHVYSFSAIPIELGKMGLPKNLGFREEGGKYYLLDKVTELTLVEIIERSEEELIALVERRMLK